MMSSDGLRLIRVSSIFRNRKERDSEIDANKMRKEYNGILQECGNNPNRLASGRLSLLDSSLISDLGLSSLTTINLVSFLDLPQTFFHGKLCDA